MRTRDGFRIAGQNSSLPCTGMREHFANIVWTGVAIMKDALFGEINLGMRSLQEQTDVGNWTTRGLRKAGRDYDEVECQRAVAGFLAAHQERDDMVE
jgi:hypothetical protein